MGADLSLGKGHDVNKLVEGLSRRARQKVKLPPARLFLQALQHCPVKHSSPELQVLLKALLFTVQETL